MDPPPGYQVDYYWFGTSANRVETELAANPVLRRLVTSSSRPELNSFLGLCLKEKFINMDKFLSRARLELTLGRTGRK